MNRKRLRDLGISIGTLPTGRWNAITDVPGVLVGQTTIIADEPRIARTGVTMILPREGDFWANHCFAGYHRFNGNGEMTGLMWIDEAGVLTTPIGITNTHQVGLVRDVIVEYARSRANALRWLLPVVAETYDGVLNDIDAFHLQRQHVWDAIETARSGPVDEGNVGGGTGMRCHQFKGGIGTSSRVVQIGGETYTLGALVQANYGAMEYLRIDGVPVGRELIAQRTVRGREAEGSIIVILATDAPLLPIQCRRLAQRATVGLAEVGGYGNNTSGDLFFAFATGNDVPRDAAAAVPLRMLPNDRVDGLFRATTEAVQESILNALTAAETMTGFQATIEALPLDETLEIMRRHGRVHSRPAG